MGIGRWEGEEVGVDGAGGFGVVVFLLCEEGLLLVVIAREVDVVVRGWIELAIGVTVGLVGVCVAQVDGVPVGVVEDRGTRHDHGWMN